MHVASNGGFVVWAFGSGDGIPAHTYIAGVPSLVQAGSISRGHIQLNLLRLVAPRDFVLDNVAASSLCPANAS